ncbi:glycosyltransferase family 2 protein [Dyadobacter luticola]|uniref:Glycosyltransferase n=1 Tax=Dyadobacter luticola TaxID=1979387 RepID=A0A5R9L559_9BACT|nr:glycosyltransferase [Dyadobacter luticola]TLV03714.1 glycosyltransferase [Dyadobacter luticola]
MGVLISVVTAVYNDEQFIRQSVESILNQTYKDIEYIVVDDGSTDNTLHILNEIAAKDNRLIVITQKNQGAAAARNKAIQTATGRYIAIQDSDDISAPERLEKQLAQILKSSQNLISCSGYNVINTKGEVITTSNKTYKDINKNILDGSTAALHPTMMIPRESIIEAGGYDAFYAKTEDYDLILRLIEKGAVIEKLNEVLYGYRIRDTSESSMNNGAYIKRVYENHKARINNRPEDFSEVINDYVKDEHYVIKRQVREVFYSENYSKFLKLYFQNFSKLPANNFFLFFLYAIAPSPLKKLFRAMAIRFGVSE